MKRLCKIAVFLLVAGLILAVVGGIGGGTVELVWPLRNLDDISDSLDVSITLSDRTDVQEISGFPPAGVDEVRSVSLDLDAVAFVMEEGTDWKLEADFNPKYVTAYLRNHTLYMQMDPPHSWLKGAVHHTLVLTVPKGLELNVFDCTLDAGSVEIDTVTADETVLDVDAGSLELGTLYGGSLEVDCDAGSIDLSAKLTEDSSLDCDAGSIGLTLLDGSTLEYAQGDVNLGSVQINRKEYSGLDSDFIIPLTDRTIQNGRTLELNCDVGSIEITSD